MVLFSVKEKAIAILKKVVEKGKSGSNREILSGGTVVILFKFIELSVRYGFVILLARIAGVDEMGRYSTVIGTISAIVTIAPLGMNTAMVKLISPVFSHGEHNEVKTVYLSLLSKITAIGILVTVVVFFGSNWIADFVFNKPYFASYFKYFSLAITPYMLIHLNAQAFRGARKMGQYSFSNDVSIPLFNLLLLVFGAFFLTGAQLINFFVVIGAFLAVTVVVLEWIRVSQIFKHQISETNYDKEISNIALPLVIGNLSQQLFSWVVVLLVGRLYPDGDMAIYNVASRVAVFVSIPFIAIDSSVASRLSTYFKEKNMKDFANHMQKATLFSIVLSLPIFLVLIVFGKQLLAVFGSEFTASYPLMCILLVGQFVNVFTGPVGLALTMTDKQKQYQNIMIFTSVISTILNIILIPRYGIYGASWAIMVTTVLKNLLQYIAIKKYFGFDTLNLKMLFTKTKEIWNI